MKEKKWNILVIGSCVMILICIGAFVAVIDPFLHYHKELTGLEYPLKDERYVNDGIQRHYDYEIMITGTSMSQNFHASLVEQYFGKKTIKTAYSGATFHELGRCIQRAAGYNPNLKMVICSLDPNGISLSDTEDAYEDYPTYLYDDNPFNDVKYLYNKDVILKAVAVLNYTRSGQITPDMDAYGRFDIYRPTGREAVTGSYQRMDREDLSQPFDEESKERINKNITNNFIKLAQHHPDIQFVFYIPPYSCCYWDGLVRTNQMDYTIESLEYAVELMLEEQNISLYAFHEWTEVSTNLDYYSDTLHYNGYVCDLITEAVYQGNCRLTKDNYKEYFDKIQEIYSEMDYDAILGGQ